MFQMWLDARFVLALAALCGILAIVMSLLASQRDRKRQAVMKVWPGFVDAIVSSLTAGATIDDAIVSACAKAPTALLEVASSFARNLEGKGAAFALRHLAIAADNAAVDEFAVLLVINRKLGGAGLAELLTAHSQRVRRTNSQLLAVNTKVSATMAMARLGVCAPWVLLVLLLSRSESSQTFNTPGGIWLLMSGLAVSVLAYRFTALLGRSEEVLRVYSPYAKA